MIRTSQSRSRRGLRNIVAEGVISVLVLSLFVLKITNYADPNVLRLPVLARGLSTAADNTLSAVGNLPFLNSCPRQLRMTEVSGGYVCAQPGDRGLYADIYASYPLVGRGREAIYSSTDGGIVAAANALMGGVFEVPRYQPVRLPETPTWSENPYGAVYWRFEFYSLRPTLNLLYAFRTTHKAAYARRLVSLDMSFIRSERRSPWAWVDPHAVAFRCMSLIDTWWKLRQGHQLSEQASTVILGELEKTGLFLADPNHYQIGENHGTNEAAALYNLAVAFPGLPHAHRWLLLAKQRFEWQLKGIIDADGQLIENSPYYDFYTLEKYWEIYQYMLAQRQALPLGMAETLHSMLNFAAYILQPDSQVPLLGASLEETIHYHGVFASMARTDPTLLYVLTHGTKGAPPPVDSKFFPASELTVMRSGWQRGKDFDRSTYLTYNIGRYRTAHSNLDALGITLFGNGGDLLPDPGLFTYTPGPYRNYFHGTVSHNTVTVDRKSQFQGDGNAGQLVSKDGITYQSAESSLYSGVQHRRLVMLLGTDHVLVADQLSSSSVHTYRQMFHLFPGARLGKSGLTISGSGGTPRRQVTIQQLKPRGIRETSVIGRRGTHPAGLCSDQYGVLRSCWQISYRERARRATYLTLLTIGRPRQHGFGISVSKNGTHLGVMFDGRQLSIVLGHTAAESSRARATDPTPPTVQTSMITAGTNSQNWTESGVGTLGSRQEPDSSKGVSVTSLAPGSGGRAAMTNDAVRLDLRQHNARLALQVKGLSRVSGLALSLSNDHWAHSVTTDLMNSYTADEAGHWARIFIGPSGRMGSVGGWTGDTRNFNWAQVDGIRISAGANSGRGPAPVVKSGDLTLLPPQAEGKVVFIFDDGYQSILPAAAYMHQRGMAGDVGVIGKYVDYPTQDYLNVFQLRALQNQWGWDMANHTQEHVDAVVNYYDHHDMSGYAGDIINQAQWLEQNGLNSAPNWFIYPHGSTNSVVQGVVERYYMFARGITDNPDAYPFGNRAEVNDLEIQYPGDGEAGDIGYTSPGEILRAVRSAARHHLTLLLTFHRIHTRASDPPGYPLQLFKKVVNGIQESRVRVLTLSQLDRSDGVPVRNHIYVDPGKRAQISVEIREGDRP